MSNNIHTLPLSSGQPPSPPPQQQQIVQQQSLVSLDAIKAKLFNIPPATKILLFLNAAFGIMGFFVQESDMNLAFNPGYFFSKPWTIVTSLFYDSSFLNVT